MTRANDRYRYRAARTRIGYVAREVTRVLDRFAAERFHHVAAPKPRHCCRRAGLDLRDQRAAGVGKAERLRTALIEVLQTHADAAPRHASARGDLLRNVARHLRG